MSIGLKIKELRVKKNLTQQQLADAIGMSNDMISYYEKGQREPTLRAIEKLSNYFNVDKSYFVEKSDKPNLSDKLVEELKSQLEYFKDLLRLESEKNVRLTKTLENISSNFREGSERNARAKNGFTILAAINRKRVKS